MMSCTFTFAMLRKGMPRPKGTAAQRRRTWQQRRRRLEKAWLIKDDFSTIFRTTPQHFVLARGIRVGSRWSRTRAAKLRAAAKILSYVDTVAYSRSAPLTRDMVVRAYVEPRGGAHSRLPGAPSGDAWRMWQDLGRALAEEMKNRPNGATGVAGEGHGFAWIEPAPLAPKG